MDLLKIGNMARFAYDRQRTMRAAMAIVVSLGLESYWKYFLNHNLASGVAYHNDFHTAWMICEVSTLGMEHQLNAEQAKHLVLAAMFHDFNHSGGSKPDHINVYTAIAGFFKAHEIVGNLKIDANEVAGIIQVTQYPFIHHPFGLSRQIIRDADILFGCTEHFCKIIYVDLFSEMLVLRPELTFEQFIRGQEAFLIGVEMFTESGAVRKAEFIKLDAQPFWDKYKGITHVGR